MHNRPDIEDATLFDGLFQFIRKNTALPKAIATLTLDSPDILDMLSAIIAGDDKAPIFLHPQSHLFVLFLIQKNQIPFWQGITAYSYIMSLMQFTDKLPPKDEDKPYQRSANLSVFKLSRAGVITKEGKTYLNEICDNLSSFSIIIDKEKLNHFILSLPPIEQWVVHIPTATMDDKSFFQRGDAVREWLAIITSNYPLSGAYTGNTSQYSQHCMPSSSIVNYFIHPLRLQPIFGRTSWETLEKLHQHMIHPLPLYSPLVKTNTLEVHGRKGGFFANKEHDALHAWMASLLSEKDRHYIFYDLIPQIKEFRQQAITLRDSRLETTLNKFIHHLVDLDLSPVFHFQYPHNRLYRFISRIFPDTYKFFVLIFKAYFGSTWSQETKERWQMILNVYANQLMGKKIYTGDVDSLHIIVAISEISSLLACAETSFKWHFLQDQPWRQYQHKIHKPISINWSAVLNVIQRSSTIEALWEKLLSNTHLLLLKSASDPSKLNNLKSTCLRSLEKFNLPKAPTESQDRQPGFVASIVSQLHKKIDESKMEELTQAKARMLFK